jgi:hypothetical protein
LHQERLFSVNFFRSTSNTKGLMHRIRQSQSQRGKRVTRVTTARVTHGTTIQMMWPHPKVPHGLTYNDWAYELAVDWARYNPSGQSYVDKWQGSTNERLPQVIQISMMSRFVLRRGQVWLSRKACHEVYCPNIGNFILIFHDFSQGS